MERDIVYSQKTVKKETKLQKRKTGSMPGRREEIYSYCGGFLRGEGRFRLAMRRARG